MIKISRKNVQIHRILRGYGYHSVFVSPKHWKLFASERTDTSINPRIRLAIRIGVSSNTRIFFNLYTLNVGKFIINMKKETNNRILLIIFICTVYIVHGNRLEKLIFNQNNDKQKSNKTNWLHKGPILTFQSIFLNRTIVCITVDNSPRSWRNMSSRIDNEI